MRKINPVLLLFLVTLIVQVTVVLRVNIVFNDLNFNLLPHKGSGATFTCLNYQKTVSVIKNVFEPDFL